jgi:hypothetical protein
MIFIINFKQLGANIINNEKYSLYLNEVRKNLAANLDRSPLMRSYGYASAGDRPTLFAIFPLNFVPFVQYAGNLESD